MLIEVPPGSLGVARVAPFDLIESGERIAEVRDVEVPVCVMMGEVPHLFPFGCRFDRRKGGIWKLPDILPAPLRSVGGSSGQQ
jgi:hypothetical protein